MKTEKWVKENVEAIAIAVVMALVIRQFAIEAFKIPTESMAPTLLGDSLGGTGDRILVDKVAYRFGEPERGDVIVFKYPLNADKNYIKRLIGLPGETIAIRNGDIWVDGEIWRKPDRVQEVLFREVFQGEADDEQDLRGALSRWECPEEEWSRAGGAGLRVDSPEGESLCLFGGSVGNRAPDGSYGNTNVGDVRLRLAVTPEGPEGSEVVLRVVEGGAASELVLAVGGGESYARNGDTRLDLEGVRLEVGRTTEVSFSNVDDTLIAVVDGEGFRREYPSVRDVPRSPNSVRFGVRRGAARFTEIGIDRDVHYTNEGVLGHADAEVRVPEDCFFALGDNSTSSADSRRWRRFVLEMKDGTVVRYDTSRTDGDTRWRGTVPGTEVIRDIEGVKRLIRTEDVAKPAHSEDAPFVPRQKLIGRAFFIFWPLNPLNGHFRLRFIR